MPKRKNDDPETGTELRPKFDSAGLMTAVVTDSDSGNLLMVAFMNEEALNLTQETRIAHFYSRSRQALWKKGETSGNILNIQEMLIDCDQDAVWIKASPAGPVCHTGQTSCFYRRIENGSLEPVE